MRKYKRRLMFEECTCVYNPEYGYIVTMPGCKDASCVALLAASQAVGVSKIYGARKCREFLDTIEVLGTLGVKITRERGCYIVDWVGIGGLAEPRREVCVGYSPLVACIVAGLLATYPFSTFLCRGSGGYAAPGSVTDDADIGTMTRMLALMGARFVCSGTTLPMLVIGLEDCVPALSDEIISSDTVKSAMLLSCIGVGGRSSIHAMSALSGYTELLLKRLGAKIHVKKTGSNADRIVIDGQEELVARDIHVPPPVSDIIYVIAAAVTRGLTAFVSGILLDNVAKGVLDVFIRMGARIALVPNGSLYDARVGPGTLHGIDIERDGLRYIAEELPIICAMGACAVGRTTIVGLSVLQDSARGRLDAAIAGLAKCGVEFSRSDDYLVIYGCGGMVDGGAIIETCGDDRIAVSFAVLNMVSRAAISVNGCSGRRFAELVGILQRLGEDTRPLTALMQDNCEKSS